MPEQFDALTALKAIGGLKAKQFSVHDYVAGLLARIEAKEPEIRAWTYLDRGHAIAQARRLDEVEATENLPLFGLAVGVKDIIDTADMATENGTVLDEGRQPTRDAAAVRLLRQAGAVIMGKTVTTELAFMQPSKTRNPHNIEHTPGGSSSGSAAAVAAGMVPVALGTQTNGSVIRPASFCGIYALKPTNGLFPMAGVLEESASFDTVGVFARALEDAAAVSEVLAMGDTPGAPGQLRGRPNYLQMARSETPAAPRFAFVKTPAWHLAEEGTKEAFLKLAKDLGGQCEELPLPPEFDHAVSLHRTVMMAEIALNFGHYYERGRERLSPAAQKAVEEGRAISAVDYMSALRSREALYERLAELLAPYDAIITPPAAGPAPRGFETTGNPVFCTLWTYLATPALNLPLLQSAGLPLGIQLVGRRFSEARLFQHAAWLVNKLNAR
jgi:Asp-tRNA(Asn)/Glu-tRNA(Gln) amidotransferase A subunit family amidase